MPMERGYHRWDVGIPFFKGYSADYNPRVYSTPGEGMHSFTAKP